MTNIVHMIIKFLLIRRKMTLKLLFRTTPRIVVSRVGSSGRIRVRAFKIDKMSGLIRA